MASSPLPYRGGNIESVDHAVRTLRVRQRVWLGAFLTVVAVLWSLVLIPATEAGADGSLVYSAWESLGGISLGAPASTTWGPGRLDIFARGSDRNLWHKWYANGGWSGWEYLGSPPGGLGSDPAAVAWSTGRIDVFVAGADRQLWHKWYQDRWSGWEALGGTLVGAPAVASWAPGRLDVFVRGADNQLWHKWYAPGWSYWERLGGVLTSAPGAVSWAAGRIDVVVASTKGAAWHTFYDNGWHGFEPLGGQLAGAPALTSWAPGRLDVLVRGTDNKLWDQWYQGGWSGWQLAFLGPITSGPSAVSWIAERIDVFARGANQAVYHAVGLAGDPYLAGGTGYDISWPQCGGTYPSPPFSFGVVGVGGSQTFSHNPCLASEVASFGSVTVTLYVKLSSPQFGQPQQGDTGPAGTCAPTDAVCRSFNYGWNLIYDAYTYAVAQGVSSGLWWLDVERPASFASPLWSTDTFANSQVIAGAIAALNSLGRQAGIYSNSYQWPLIAAGYAPLVPTWQARPVGLPQAVQYCTSGLFTPGPVWLVQYGNNPFDEDVAC